MPTPTPGTDHRVSTSPAPKTAKSSRFACCTRTIAPRRGLRRTWTRSQAYYGLWLSRLGVLYLPGGLAPTLICKAQTLQSRSWPALLTVCMLALPLQSPAWVQLREANG